ncbi:MAG: 50S ribosomal protein L6 [Bacillota bacterium]|nr:50S ribosomal protein L6 [Bacillota bacterium]
MSRIGKMPVTVPSGVKVTLDGSHIIVEGPKGKLERDLHPNMTVKLEENVLTVERPSDKKEDRALHGLTRALINNMVVGVSAGFTKEMELVGVGYRAAKQGRNLVLTVGYSHPVEMEPLEGVEVDVPVPTKITISGADKEKVGAFAANVRSVRPPEPYKGKGIKYANEVIKRKAGKAGVKGE